MQNNMASLKCRDSSYQTLLKHHSRVYHAVAVLQPTEINNCFDPSCQYLCVVFADYPGWCCPHCSPPEAAVLSSTLRPQQLLLSLLTEESSVLTGRLRAAPWRGWGGRWPPGTWAWSVSSTAGCSTAPPPPAGPSTAS